MSKKDLIPVCFKVPKQLRELVQLYIAQGLHMSESDFFRDALREKIQKDAPQLYINLFREKVKIRNG